MKRIARTILAQAPKRRRRMWKYVSPQRRRLGLLLLAMLITLFYAGWFFTRPSRIRREAKQALESLTGADVDVDKARFSLFEGIRLHNVRVRIRGDDAPFFTAREVVLKHRPSGLLFRRRLEPTDIVCLHPVVNLEYEDDSSNAERLFLAASSQKREEDDSPPPLPRILLKDGLLRSRVRRDGLQSPPMEEPFNAALTPEGGRTYEVTVQGPRRGGEPVEWARLALDVDSGDIRPISWSASDRWFGHLPPRYRRWIDRYRLRGDFSLIEGSDTDPAEERYEIVLTDFSMNLPEPEGNLTLSRVHGKLLFTRDGVEMQSVTGRIDEAGGATFTLNGRYEGYDTDSPFTVRIDVRDIEFPEALRGPLAKMVDTLQREFQPVGRADLSLTFRRDETGRSVYEGVLKPKDVQMVYRRFPLPVERVRGQVHFTQAGPNQVSLTGRRGAATFTVEGTLSRRENRTLYDITVRAQQARFDDALRDALPKRYHKLWRQLHPSGCSDVDVRVTKTEPSQHAVVAVDIHMKGQAAVTYERFAYPLTNLAGEVTFRRDRGKVLWARAQMGAMRCDLQGEVRGLMSKHPSAEFSIQATDVPLDRTLLGALQGRAREWLEELSPGGTIGRVEAKVRKPADGPLHYHIAAKLQDASFCYAKFPYPVRSVTGEVTITPEQAVFKDLQGRHGQAQVRVSGTMDVQTAAEAPPAYDLSIQAREVPLEAEFRDALPSGARRVWESLSPAGQADIDLTMRSTGRAKPDYRLVLDVKNGSLRYRDFPYTFRGVTGRACITRNRVALEAMQAAHGSMQAHIDGEIRYDDAGRQDMTLRLSAKDVRIDENLLAAIPAEVVPLAEKLAPGGQLDVELSALRIRRRPAGSASAPASAPAADEVAWSAEGKLDFRDLVLDLGFGPRTLTGTLRGAVGQDRRKLRVDTQAELTRLALKQHELTNLTFGLRKNADSNVLQVDHFSGKVHDGKISGQANLRLEPPIRYELSASLWNLDMAKLVNAGRNDPQTWVNVSGRLSGRLSLEATGGKHPTRQAEGELIFSKGRLFELPVILGLLNVVYLQLPSETAFHRGFVNYHLKNDLLRFYEIYLTGWDDQTNTGKGISILGAGTLEMKTDKLNLTFLTGPPGKLPRLSELAEDLLEALSRSLVEIRVTGTLEKPKMDTVPLSPLATIIRRLVEPSLKTE